MDDTSREQVKTWIRFQDFLTQDLPRIGTENWVTVYDSRRDEEERSGVFSILIPSCECEKVLESYSWDEHVGFGAPGHVIWWQDDVEKRQYFRFGDDTRREPFVFLRMFDGAKPSYVEIAEEFRHFHNLHEELPSRRLVAIDEAGDDDEVVRITGKLAKVKLSYLKQFLAAKDMALVLYFDVFRFSECEMSELGLTRDVADVRDQTTRCQAWASPWESVMKSRHKSFTRLLGKKVIGPGTREAGDPQKEYASFITGINANGEAVYQTADPDRLEDYFGSNPGATQYLTPVFFRREVLNKYYANPKKYSVEDGYLRCGGLWGVQIDNNHPKYVVVFFGDLGRDLPYKEQLYWHSFNVIPEGAMSEVNFRRSILAQPTSPTMKDLLFKETLSRFERDWYRVFGWDLFKPLADDDQHYYAALRIPLTDQQAEFDEQTLALGKVLIDSLNDKELTRLIPAQPPDTKSIAKLDAFLASQGVKNYCEHLSFLRLLWNLRHGAGHRKSNSYKNAAAALKLYEKGFVEAFEDILDQAIALLKFLHGSFIPS